MSADWNWYAIAVLERIASNMRKGMANEALVSEDAKDVQERINDLLKAAEFLKGVANEAQKGSGPSDSGPYQEALGTVGR